MKKMKLQTLDLYQLHHAEFGQFIIRLVEDFRQSKLNISADSDFATLFEQLKGKIPSYNKALEQIRENENTQKIADLDTVRDQDFQALKDSIKPYRNTKKENQKQAYDALKIVLDEYKNVAGLSYEEETKKINTLLSTLGNSEYKPHTLALKIEDFVAELEKSNKEFDTLFAKRSIENIGKETYDTKALRREMTEIYRKLATYVLALAPIKSDELYKQALDTINNSRKYYADTLAKRGGMSKGKKKAEDKGSKKE